MYILLYENVDIGLYIYLYIYKHVCMELKYIAPRSICNLSIIMWFVARLYLHLH